MAPRNQKKKTIVIEEPVVIAKTYTLMQFLDRLGLDQGSRFHHERLHRKETKKKTLEEWFTLTGLNKK